MPTTLGICDVGTCVECTGPQRGACGTNVCNSRTRLCSNNLAGSATTCATCVSDAQCEPDARCVQQVFGGTVIGDFCLPIPTGGSCNGVRPFVGLVTVATLDSATPTGVCTLRATTCPGLNDAAEPCDQDADCGAAGAADGLCVEFGGDNQCTTPCSSPNDCNGACDTSACAL